MMWIGEQQQELTAHIRGHNAVLLVLENEDGSAVGDSHDSEVNKGKNNTTTHISEHHFCDAGQYWETPTSQNNVEHAAPSSAGLL